jgi:hypothetical protein
VGEELVDGDVGDPLLVGGLAVFVVEDGAGAEDLVSEVELALFEEGEDGDRGDGLEREAMRKRLSCWTCVRCWRSPIPTD